MGKLGILIINPPVRLDDKPRNLPHGLAILASIIRRETSIGPVFLDVNAHRYNPKQVKDIIEKSDFDVVLIGGLASAYRYIVEIAELINRVNPEARIVSGGYVAMPLPTLLLKNSSIEIACTGEGEVTVAELLRRFQRDGLQADIADIKGLCYRDRRDNRLYHTSPRPFINNLDEESAPPAYDLLPMEIYLANSVAGIGRDIDMITVRGCPFRCTFCYQPFGHKPRLHSVGFITEAIRRLRADYNIDFISFQDDEFMVHKKRVREFCEERNRYFPGLLWSCTGRADIIAHSEDLVDLMKRSGCVSISCGFESGSRRILESMHKAQTIEDMEKTVEILRRYHLPIPASFIIGMPGEDEQSCQQTLDFCLRNNIHLDSLMFATPYPGTEIFNFALRTGRIKEEGLHEFMMRLGDARDFLINLTDSFSDEQLIRKRKQMMKVTIDSYNKLVSTDTIMEKMRGLYGDLLDRVKLDERDLEHKAKHGGALTF